MALLTSYDEVGIKESFSDLISNISPTYTPFISGCGTETIKNTMHQWLQDTLDTPAANAQIEGFTASPDTCNEPTKTYNITQIFEKTVQVSRTANTVSLYGRSKEMAYQLGKKAKSAKRDLEYACVGSKQALVQGSKTAASTFAGVQAMIDSSLLFPTGTTTLDEPIFANALEQTYVNGAEPNTFLINPADAKTTNAYAASAGRERTIVDGNKTVTNAVNIYASSFGDIKITMDRWIAAGDALVYDPSDYKLLVLQNWAQYDLAKTGDSDVKMIVGEFSLKHANSMASAIVRHT